MKRVLWYLAAFLAAHVASVNVVRLVPTNPNYEAQWWKVAVGCFFFVWFICIANEERRA